MIKTLLFIALKLGILGLCMVIVFMKGKPVIAFYLAFKDFLKEDRKEFRGYGIYNYVGLGGTGKTLSMVDYMAIMKRQYPKLKIFTNFDFDLADGKFTQWQDIVNFENIEFKEVDKEQFDGLRDNYKIEQKGKYYKKVNNGVVFGFDEIHMTLNSQKWKEAPEDLLYQVSQNRKCHKMILCSAQVQSRVNIILREQSNAVIECKAWFKARLIFNRFYHVEGYLTPAERKGGKTRIKPFKKYSYVAYDSIRKLYDTEQVMVDLLKNNQTDEEKIFNEFKKYMKLMLE